MVTNKQQAALICIWNLGDMAPWGHSGLRCARVVAHQLHRGAEFFTDEGEKRLVACSNSSACLKVRYSRTDSCGPLGDPARARWPLLRHRHRLASASQVAHRSPDCFQILDSAGEGLGREQDARLFRTDWSSSTTKTRRSGSFSPLAQLLTVAILFVLLGPSR